MAAKNIQEPKRHNESKMRFMHRQCSTKAGGVTKTKAGANEGKAAAETNRNGEQVGVGGRGRTGGAETG